MTSNAFLDIVSGQKHADNSNRLWTFKQILISAYKLSLWQFFKLLNGTSGDNSGTILCSERVTAF